MDPFGFARRRRALADLDQETRDHIEQCRAPSGVTSTPVRRVLEAKPSTEDRWVTAGGNQCFGTGLTHQSFVGAMKYVDLNRGFRDLTQSEVQDPELLLAIADSP